MLNKLLVTNYSAILNFKLGQVSEKFEPLHVKSITSIGTMENKLRVSTTIDWKELQLPGYGNKNELKNETADYKLRL